MNSLIFPVDIAPAIASETNKIRLPPVIDVLYAKVCPVTLHTHIPDPRLVIIRTQLLQTVSF